MSAGDDYPYPVSVVSVDDSPAQLLHVPTDAPPHRALSAPLPFEREGYGVNKPAAWRRLYGEFWGYARDFGWRAAFLGGGCE